MATAEIISMKKNSDIEKTKALESALSQIERQFGKGSIMRLDNEASIQNVVAISSGSICIDSALGVGGFPRGRIIEIYGPEASGKTTLALHAIAETQANGGVTAFVDAEHAFDPSYARGIGIKTDELLISQPDYGEQALEIVDQLVRSSAVDMVVVDYIQLMRPSSNIRDGRVQEISEITQGLKAIAKELGVPVVALSQLSRQVEQRDDHKPQLADLRESGSIEQDADVVMFVYREGYYLQRKEPREATVEHAEWQAKMNEVAHLAQIIIGKQRHGPIGNVTLEFEERFTKFKDTQIN